MNQATCTLYKVGVITFPSIRRASSLSAAPSVAGTFDVFTIPAPDRRRRGRATPFPRHFPREPAFRRVKRRRKTVSGTPKLTEKRRDTVNQHPALRPGSLSAISVVAVIVIEIPPSPIRGHGGRRDSDVISLLPLPLLQAPTFAGSQSFSLRSWRHHLTTQ